MNTLMMILLTLASWGQGIKKLMGFSENTENTANLCEKRASGVQLADKYPWIADIRIKTKQIPESDRKAAISFLERNLDSSVGQKLKKFENYQLFDSIMISDNQADKVLQSIAQQISCRDVQRAILLIVLAVGATNRLGAGSLDLRKCIQQFDDEGITIVPHKDTWAVKMKSGAFWPAETVKFFMR